MADDADNEDTFDEEELAEGFEEDADESEVIADDVAIDTEDGAEDLDGEDLDEEDNDGEGTEDDGDEAVPADGAAAAVAAAPDEDDLIDDADVELALDEVLAETILRKVVPEDDDDTVVEIDGTLESTETILPKQDDEFRCRSCRLLKKTSQLADKDRMLCRDCV